VTAVEVATLLVELRSGKPSLLRNGRHRCHNAYWLRVSSQGWTSIFVTVVAMS
jgi:hypothetical protein